MEPKRETDFTFQLSSFNYRFQLSWSWNSTEKFIKNWISWQNYYFITRMSEMPDAMFNDLRLPFWQKTSYHSYTSENNFGYFSLFRSCCFTEAFWNVAFKIIISMWMICQFQWRLTWVKLKLENFCYWRVVLENFQSAIPEPLRNKSKKEYIFENNLRFTMPDTSVTDGYKIEVRDSIGLVIAILNSNQSFCKLLNAVPAGYFS